MRVLAALFLMILPFPLTSPSATATEATGEPAAVGSLFSLTPAGDLGSHFCTATVVASPSGDVVVTAAHCLVGRTGMSLAFVPGYVRGRAPLGIWRVTKTFVDQAWASSADPDHDVAFLTVAPHGATTLESLTGGEAIGGGPAIGQRATVAGYPASLDTVISCTNALLEFGPTQLEFDCGGYTNGTSGSALIVDPSPITGLGVVVGVIGGYEEGGDTPDVSYAAAFSAWTTALYESAATADAAAHT